MLVENLSLQKNGKYEVQIDNHCFILDEDTVLKFRLLKGHELDDKTLEAVKLFDQVKVLENTAINYALRYGKSSLEVARYLEKKDISKNLAMQIVTNLVQKKIINDLDLAKNMASYLARTSNGPMMIKTKLISHLFSEEIIEIALHSVGENDYQIGYDKLEKKASMKFAKLNAYERKMKIREYFYRHGYLSD